MDVSAPTARVNGAQLAQQIGKKVRFVCKTESVEGNLMRVIAADNMPVTVQLTGSGAYDTEYLEFEGIVENSSTVKELEHTNFGNKFGESCMNPTGYVPKVRPSVVSLAATINMLAGLKPLSFPLSLRHKCGLPR